MRDRIINRYSATFIGRVYNTFRDIPGRVDVFVHCKRSEQDIPAIEISIHVSDERHVTGHFTPEDGEALIETIRKAIDELKTKAPE